MTAATNDGRNVLTLHPSVYMTVGGQTSSSRTAYSTSWGGPGQTTSVELATGSRTNSTAAIRRLAANVVNPALRSGDADDTRCGCPGAVFTPSVQVQAWFLTPVVRTA